MVSLAVPEIEYDEYNNRQLLVVPLVVLTIALCIIGGWYIITGSPANLGLEFTGGTEIRIGMDDADSAAAARDQIRAGFDADPDSIREVAGNVYVISFGPSADTSTLEAQAGEIGELRAIEQVSASFGAGIQTTALGGVAIAFLGMSVLVFVLFRTLVPSLAVVSSAFSDIVVPVAVMNLIGIEMTLGTVAALLMLIGYSVDSDILLNNAVLRRTGDFYESVHGAMRTGVTMTLTSMSAMIVMTITAAFFGIDLLRDIGIILVVGLCTDLMNTYLLNVSLLRWYKYKRVVK